MLHYDAVFIGASMAACAAACQLQKSGLRILLVEKGNLTAPEFTVALRQGENSYAPQHAETARFIRELQAHSILSEGTTILPALHPALCQQLTKARVRCLFRTRVCGIQKDKAGYALSLLSLGNHIQIATDTVLDSSWGNRAQSDPQTGEDISKTLTYITGTPGKKGFSYHSVSVPQDLSQQNIVPWFYSYWQAQKDSRYPEKVCAIAKEFSYSMGTQSSPFSDEKYGLVPQGDTWQQAYDLGIDFAKRLVKHHGIV